MKIQSDEVRDNLQRRLRRIEGQVRGVQKMVDDDRDCHEVIQQLSAIRSAVEKATDLFMRTHAKECLSDFDGSDSVERETLIDNLMDLMVKAR